MLKSFAPLRLFDQWILNQPLYLFLNKPFIKSLFSEWFKKLDFQKLTKSLLFQLSALACCIVSALLINNITLLLIALVLFLFWLYKKACYRNYYYLAFIACILLCISYSCLRVQMFKQKQLNDSIRPFYVQTNFQVYSLVTHKVFSEDKTVQRFNARLINTQLSESDSALLNQGGNLENANIALSCFDCEERFRVGDVYQAKVRVKRPHSIQSYGAFDYERWLLQQVIAIQGSIKSAQFVDRKINTLSIYINSLREAIKHKIINSKVIKSKNSAVILALLIGDKSALSLQQKELFKETGVAHLLAISGLHLGMFFGAVYGFIYLIGCLCRFSKRKQLAAWLGLIAAFIYCLLAGFSLPTQRSFIMLFCLLAGQLFNVQLLVSTRIVLSLVLILLINPMSVFDGGLYLSYVAVIALVLGFVNLHKFSWIKSLLLSQYVVFLFMLPLSLYVFGQASLLMPVVNLLVLPLISIVVLPLIFSYLPVMYLSPQATEKLSFLIDFLLTQLQQQLEIVQLMQRGLLLEGYVSFKLLMLLFLLAASVLIFKKRQYLLLYGVLFLSAFLPYKTTNPLQLSVIDVGQGLSVLVQTSKHTLLYDVGNAYPSGFNLFNSSIEPFLRKQRIKRLDRVVLSHADADHAGSLPYLLQSIQVKGLLVGDHENLHLPNHGPSHKQPLPTVMTCEQGQRWRWDTVSFDVIYANPTSAISNNRSCVLLIEYQGQFILLPGDIDKSIELDILPLLKQRLAGRSLSVLIASHHGSKTSSHQSFIQALNPQHVVFSAGFHHHFNHPHPDVVERFASIESQLWNTAYAGTINFAWGKGGSLTVNVANKARFWQLDANKVR